MTTSKQPGQQPTAAPLERSLDIVVTHGSPAPSTGSFLLVVDGAMAGKLFPLNRPELIVGRSPQADIRLNEKAVSHTHARIRTDGGHCTIEDLKSTNGTTVNNELVGAAIQLRAGDTVGIGSTTFTFLSNSDSEQTVELGPPRGAVSPGYLERVRSQPSLPPAFNARAAQGMPLAHASEEGVSLTDVLRKVHAAWIYTKRYGWLVTVCTLFGAAAGIVHTRLSPPPGSAWFEVNLFPQGSANPMVNPEEAASANVQFFLAPANTFRSLPLIKKTLDKLNVPNATDEQATDVQEELMFEQQGFQSTLWRGEFRSATAESAKGFLKTHLQLYLDHEIDKSVLGIQRATQFVQSKLEAAQAELKQAEARLLEFKDKHPEAVPKDDILPNPLTAKQNQARSVEGELSRVEHEIALVRKKLQDQVSLARVQVEKARKYVDQAMALRGEIAQKRAQGLGDQHPDIKRLKNEVARLLELARRVEREEVSAAEKATDQETLRLKDELATLERKRSALQAQLGVARKQVEKEQLQSLPELQSRYQQLKRDYDAKAKRHQALFDDLEAKRLQLDMERAAGPAHYNVITPPTAVEPSLTSATIKRGGLGGFVGLVLAVLAAAILELRQRILARKSYL